MPSCARCGRTNLIVPARYFKGGVSAYYCHTDDDKSPTCYELAVWSGFPEVAEALNGSLRP